MSRQNFLDEEPWNEHYEEHAIRARHFALPRGSMMGASLHELEPGSPGFKLHVHYGREEMFFVVSGHPTLRDGKTEERLSPGDFVHCPEGKEGVHAFTNPSEEPARILSLSAGRYPDVVAYPEDGVAWVATRDPDREPDGPDEGLIARFELPEER